MPLVDIIVDIKQRILVKIIGDRLEKVAKIENISKSELNQAKMLQKKINWWIKRDCYNPDHNILRHFDVWQNFCVTTSETNRDY